MKKTVQISVPIVSTPRVLQMSGLFDVPASKRAQLSWEVDLPLEKDPWQIGLIVGPSGCGKSTIAREFWPEEIAHRFEWPEDRSVLDAFPASMSIKDIVELLSSVGFSSPPSWVRPFRVLSNGEQFRVSMARLLAELPELAVVDEFTSVVDRTVAQIGSAALAKTVRRRKQKFIAVTCHEDVEAWLDPDWVYRPAIQQFARRSLQRRPAVELKINRVHHSAWALFHAHHYLSASLNQAAVCFVAFFKDQPVAFCAYLPFVGVLKNMRRVHRVVCLPDYQGIGIGNALVRQTAAMWKALGSRASIATAHQGQIAAYSRNKLWRMLRAPGFSRRDGGKKGSAYATSPLAASRSVARLTASFEYMGPPLTEAEARVMMDSWAITRGAPNRPVIAGWSRQKRMTDAALRKAIAK